MSAAIATVEQVLIQGNLADLSPEQRVHYYNRVCESLSLNPLTKPFEYLHLNGKLILYARRDCAEQLRKRDKVSTQIKAREVVDGTYVVSVQAATPDGRTDESIGAVPLDGLKGEARANAMMKAETKAKRRVTLSICGLGMLDETEVESMAPVIQQARPAIAASEDPPDAMAVNEFLGLMKECKNKAELADVAEKVKANTKLTDQGRGHLRKFYLERVRELPAVNEEADEPVPY